MNSLRREIVKGEVVILRASIFKPEYQEQKYRVVKCMDGFGMLNETNGRAIYVHFLSDGEEARFNGDEIDPSETEQYQAEHGKFVPS